ncbi:MAG: sensor histidine kinase, partial [Kaistella sp.]
FSVFNKYVNYIAIVNLFIIAISIWLSWIISNNLTRAVTKFSDKINQITLFEDDPKPIKYYHNDELNQLVKAYNKMILQIQEQKQRLSFKEKEEAWREMAKQVAHEVKNPLTPMKLTIQNFERKFDPADPDIRNKVKHLSRTLVDQIDLVATVASAFSQFAQLPEKNNEIFDLNKEIKNIINVFSDEKIYFHSNKDIIMVEMDKIYLSRIITNLVANARQAKHEDRDNIINLDVELRQKRVIITVHDNGTGIPEELYDRIFEPNFTSKSSGTGLGLTMVRKMVEDYKGKISVKSEDDKGSTFTISLPTNV